MESLQKNLSQMEKQLKQMELDIKNISKGADEDDRFPKMMAISFFCEISCACYERIIPVS